MQKTKYLLVLMFLGLGASLGCGGSEEAVVTIPDPDLSLLSCEDLKDLWREAVQDIDWCDSDSDCGKPILTPGSCGCTHDSVVNKNADTSYAEKVLSEIYRRSRDGERGCEMLYGTCDCPPADGFICKENRCEWNYQDLPILNPLGGQ